MRLDAFLPQQAPSCRIDRVIPTCQIAEHERTPRRVLVDRNGEYCGANRSICLKNPVHASRSNIKSLHGATGTTNEKIRSNDGRCADCVHVSLETVCPFQFQPPYLVECQTSGFARLVPSVFSRRTPSIPRTFGNARQIHVAIGTIALRRRSRIPSGNPEKCCHRFAFLARHRRCHIHHHSEIQSAKDSRYWELLQCVPRWNARVGGIVT